jgi:hypothetical protein
MLHNNDCFLRLPSREDLYEMQQVTEAPYFATIQQSPTEQDKATLGNMSYLIAISSTWSDVLQNLYRTKHQVEESQVDEYEMFYEEKQQQLQAFIDRLPEHLYPCTTRNIELSLENGYLGTFISLHALYLTTLMKLNRHAKHAELDEDSIKRNLRAAQYNARELLKVTNTLAELHREQQCSQFAWIFSTPFQGYSILAAVDILTSIGSLNDLNTDMQLVQSSLEVMQELSKYWASAQKQLDMIAVRFGMIMKALENASEEDTVFFTTEPMEDTFGRELDLLFSLPVEERFRAIGLGSRRADGSDVLTIQSRSSGMEGYGN